MEGGWGAEGRQTWLQQQAGEGWSPHGFARSILARRGSGDAAAAETILAVRMLLWAGETAALVAEPVLRDSPLRGYRPRGVTGDDDHWSRWRRLSIFHYLCFLLLALLIYSPVKRDRCMQLAHLLLKFAGAVL